MRLRLLFFATMVITSCNSSDENAEPELVTSHTAYVATEKLNESLMKYVCDNLTSMVVATSKNEIFKPGILVYKLTASGDLAWGRKIKSNDESYISISSLLKLPGENYFLLAKHHADNGQLLFKFDNGANLLLSRKIEIEGEPVQIYDAYLNDTGNVICTGSLANNNSIVFEFNIKSNKINWSKQFDIKSSGGFAVASGNSNFITIVDVTGNLFLIRTNSKGDMIFTKKYFTSGAHFNAQGRIIVIGENLYLISQLVDSEFLSLVRLNLSGDIKTAVRMRDVSFSDVKASGNDLIFSITVEQVPTLVKLNTDLEILNHKTIGTSLNSNQPAEVLLGINDQYISCVTKPNAFDQTVSDKGINLTTINKKNWNTSCELTQNDLVNDFISAITIYEQVETINSEDIMLTLSDFNVSAEDISLTKAILCEQ